MPKSIDEFDWASTPLGPVDSWSPALLTTYQILMGTGFAACATWGAEQTLLYNAAYIPFLGARHPGALGQPIDVVWREVWDDIRPLIKQALDGERVYLEDLPLVVERWGAPEETYWTFSYSPLRDGERIMGMLDIAIETTGRVKAERHRQLLVEESGHRVKNTLALVQSVARQSLKDVADRESVDRFEERLLALARAQQALQKSSGHGGDLGEVISLALSHLTSERVELSGSPVVLSPRVAQAVSLVIHELATNAFKYGALSVAEGGVAVHWDVADSRLVLTWIERGGPEVIAPKKNGFGSKLLRRGLTGEGAAELSYDPEGFRAAFSTTLASLQED
ncbi:sensor histidine kinase [Caulobacter sp. FWC2]|uniref:sensor histidine kinase n=1 Tax=Caulobacter sp. FWC2 TaxID=69664 RepID=UPI001177CA18|nr:PAS domain-containing sensor histidine kinase [Caulobacter sp. FWC2]